MKKISRLLAILLVLLMLATMSVSCKKKDDGDDEAIVDTDDGANNENSVDADDNGDDGASDDKEDSKDTNKKEENKTDSSTNNKTETVDKEQAIEQGTQKGEGHGTWVEDEDGNILSTNDHEVDDEYRIQGAVTNDNGDHQSSRHDGKQLLDGEDNQLRKLGFVMDIIDQFHTNPPIFCVCGEKIVTSPTLYRYYMVLSRKNGKAVVDIRIKFIYTGEKGRWQVWTRRRGKRMKRSMRN